MSKTIQSRIKLKRDTSANWTSNNPVLLDGEQILVDTAEGELRAKVGDGTKTYTQLPFTDEVLRSLINGKANSDHIHSYNDLTNKPTPDWNQNDETAADYIKNRPFYSVDKAMFEWDGNTDGLENNEFCYKISDLTPTYDQNDTYIFTLVDGAKYFYSANDSNVVIASNDFVNINYRIVITYSDNVNVDGIIFTSPGIWFFSTVRKFEIKGSVTTIPEFYTPGIITAQTTANSAKTTAETAQTTAETAQTTANSAKTTAETAQTTAETAQTTANSAKTTAETAQTTAETAQTTANSAKTTANSAKTTAENALPRSGGVLTGSLDVNGQFFVKSSAFKSVSGSICIKPLVDAPDQIWISREKDADTSSKAVLQFVPNGASGDVYLRGIECVRMRSSGNEKFDITVDDTGEIIATNITDSTTVTMATKNDIPTAITNDEIDAICAST